MISSAVSFIDSQEREYVILIYQESEGDIKHRFIYRKMSDHWLIKLESGTQCQASKAIDELDPGIVTTRPLKFTNEKNHDFNFNFLL